MKRLGEPMHIHTLTGVADEMSVSLAQQRAVLAASALIIRTRHDQRLGIEILSTCIARLVADCWCTELRKCVVIAV